ncbi:anaphase-promoting complex subunit 1 [Anopheles nili]|uniref:anaphase-promoting complex subunit 1 n=1 Tax=Anopheles nili TaxID=185578 RepID=UPI00237B7267|nr:anaphase-promoting complex subunit 1 [Anopheles nili]
MITATEPREFIPRGRQVAGHHPGPAVFQEQPYSSYPADFVLLQRMQNVNISLNDEDPVEFYRLREVPIEQDDAKPAQQQTGPAHLAMPYICTEEELYVRGRSAVWTRSTSEHCTLPHISFTSDSPIKFAFFGPRQFNVPDTLPPGTLEANRTTVCLMDKDTLHVYCEGGETYKATIQCPVSAVWIVPDGIVLERESLQPQGTSTVQERMPRLFTLTFPLDDMKPVLLAAGASVSYLDDPECHVVFTSEQLALVLLYSDLYGKHFICRYRRVTKEELQVVNNMQESTGGEQTDASCNTANESVFASANLGEHSATKPTIRTGLSSASLQSVGAHSERPNLASANSSINLGRFGVAGAPQSLLSPFQAGSYSFSEHSSRLGEDVTFGMDRNATTEQLDPRGFVIEPEYTLQHVWTDEGRTATGPGGVPIQLWSAANGEKASEGFLHTDLVGNNYLCYLQPRAARLTLVQYDAESLEIHTTRTVPARSAVSLERLNMIVLLDLHGKLVLYSGPTAVGKLHLTGLPTAGLQMPATLQSQSVNSGRLATGTPSAKTSSPMVGATVGEALPRRSTLLPHVSAGDGKLEEQLHQLSPVRPLSSGSVGFSPHNTTLDHSPIVKLRDATGSRFTLVLANERMFRLALAPVAESRLLRCCLTALLQVVPGTVAHEFIIRWYGTRNVPGTQAGFSAQQEWVLFRPLFFAALGRPVGPPDLYNCQSTGSSVSGPAGVSCAGGEEPKKRRRAEDSSGESIDWEYLLHHTEMTDVTGMTFTIDFARTVTNGPHYQNRDPHSLFPFILELMQIFHLLYEDCKLDTTRAEEQCLLADILLCLAIDTRLKSYQLHYLTDFPELTDRYQAHKRCIITDTALLERLAQVPDPPHVFRFIERMLNGFDVKAPFPNRSGINERTTDMLTLVALLYRVESARGWVQKRLVDVLTQKFFDEQSTRSLCLRPSESSKLHDVTADTLLAFLVERGYTRKHLERLPIGMRFVMMQCLEGYRAFLIHGQRAAYYELLMRPELHAHGRSSGLKRWMPNGGTNTSPELSPTVKLMPQYGPIMQWQHEMSDIEVRSATGTGVGGGTGAGGTAAGGGTGGTGTGGTNTQKDGLLRQESEPGMSGLDEEVLELLFPDDKRIEDVRGFLNSSQRLLISVPQPSNMADHDFQEEQERRLYALCLRAMALPVGRGMFTVSSSRPIATQTVPMPLLCLGGRDTIRGATVEFLQTEIPANFWLWPSFHNGVAAGLRICPDTLWLTSSWITHNRKGGGERNSHFLVVQHDGSTEHGGFLMALGLSGHLRKLSLYSTFDYMVRSEEMVRLGLLLGLSAAYRGTSDLLMTRLLAVHVEALLPPTAVELDVTQNLQVAALLGVGLVYLRTGKRHMAEVLLQEIGRPPGPEMENYVERESYALTAGLALGLVTLGMGEELSALHDLALPDTLYYYMNGGFRRSNAGSQKEKYRLPSFQIKEGGNVNVDVTAPGATLALGLMFFATGNEAISRWLEPPTTNYSLGFVRPDLLLLRTISRNLIQWNAIEPTRAWLEEQVPPMLRCAATDKPSGEAEETMHWPRGAPTTTERQLYGQAYCSLVCGSAVAIGLRYAGTADQDAADTLEYYLHYFIEQGASLLEESRASSTLVVRLAGCQAIENCTMMVLLALSLVLAGTGSLRVLRAVRLLRARITLPHVTYGSQMAIHMALGFVFLGAGRYTLSRTPTAIAALLCSIFPKFPTYSNDNRYHLQAFRHLYVLAIEPRIFLPRNIDTGHLCLCRVRFAMRHRKEPPVEQFAPCLLPELDTLEWVEVCDESFWHFRFDHSNWEILETLLKRCGRVDVKQHIGRLSHQEDPSRLIMSQILSIATQDHPQWHIVADDLLQLEGQQAVINTTRKLLMPPDTHSLRCQVDPFGLSENEEVLIEVSTLPVADCVMNDHLHALPFYLDLLKILLHVCLEDYPIPLTTTWQLRLLQVVLGKRHRPHARPDSRPLLAIIPFQSLVQRIVHNLDKLRFRYEILLRRYLGADMAPNDELSLVEQLTMLCFRGNQQNQADPSHDPLELAELMQLIVVYDLPYFLIPRGTWNLWDMGWTNDELRMLILNRYPDMMPLTVEYIIELIQAHYHDEITDVPFPILYLHR